MTEACDVLIRRIEAALTDDVDTTALCRALVRERQRERDLGEHDAVRMRRAISDGRVRDDDVAWEAASFIRRRVFHPSAGQARMRTADIWRRYAEWADRRRAGRIPVFLDEADFRPVLRVFWPAAAHLVAIDKDVPVADPVLR